MANLFRTDGTRGGPMLDLSNGGTDVLFDVLTLAGCHLARTPWEQHLILMFATRHRGDRGTAGFDLTELPWTANWPAEKAFFLAVLDLAVARHRWDELDYDPPHAHDYVRTVRTGPPRPIRSTCGRASGTGCTSVSTPAADSRTVDSERPGRPSPAIPMDGTNETCRESLA
ncbi:hypothetical protein [Actinoplanes sandaracinus]|uniref:hypothetical protein n=1 Tax=Actinoplanes sandaracinus TaxID=3045177 RepID=UPI0024A9DFB1|nr:hypothetical protein [Actinoplanes sandaracinus]